MKPKFLVALTACAVSLIANLHAEQGGTGHYTSGGTASFIDALPDQPGFAAENLFLCYADANAHAAKGLPFGDRIALHVNANAYADTVVLTYTLKPQVLGGHFAFAVAPSFVSMDIKATGTIDLHGVAHSGTVKDSAHGFGDLEFWPLMLGWTNGDFKYDVRCAVYAPSGEYDASQLANVGQGYWTFEPAVTFSWLSSKLGTEVSVFAGLDFNTENTDAHYQSGDIFHLDTTVAQHLPLLGGDIGAGANAFYYRQINGDSGSGARLGDFKAESYGIGPVLSYIHKIGRLSFVGEAKWLPQLHADNTTKGNYIWVKLGLLF